MRERHREIDWRLWLVGDGKEYRRCQHWAAANGLGTRVRFFHFQHDPFPFYAAADVAVSVSREDSLPNFLIEAQATGLPVVAYDCRGVNDMAASLYADFVVCPACTYGEVFSAFLLDDESRQRWLRNIQYARTGYFSPTAQVHPRGNVGGLSGSTANSYFFGVQAGLARLRMNSTSMYTILN